MLFFSNNENLYILLFTFLGLVPFSSAYCDVGKVIRDLSVQHVGCFAICSKLSMFTSLCEHGLV